MCCCFFVFYVFLHSVYKFEDYMNSMFEILMDLPLFQGVSRDKLSELIEKYRKKAEFQMVYDLTSCTIML